jgi:hypothetical protein
MSITSLLKRIFWQAPLHKIAFYFYPNFRKEAKKRYHLRRSSRGVLDEKGIIALAGSYGFPEFHRITEEGLRAVLMLIGTLVAEGYDIKTILFEIESKAPGEYNGYEKHLPHGVYPYPCIRPTQQFHEYISRNARVDIRGKARLDGFISRIEGAHGGGADNCIIPGGAVSVYGLKLKIAGAGEPDTGLFFVEAGSGKRYPAGVEDCIVNTPGCVIALAPAALPPGIYTLEIVTRYASNGKLLQTPRIITSDIELTVRNFY